MTAIRRAVGLTLGLATLLAVDGLAQAKRTVAVLAFGGPRGESVRGSIVRPLRKQYTIVHGQELLDACDALGIAMSRGRNLARAAKHIGAVAVVGGTISGGSLSLAVYSGKSGQPLATGRVALSRGRVSRAGLRQALSIILKGLSKAPRSVGTRRRRPPPPPPPPPEEEEKSGKSGNLVFEPEPVEQSNQNQRDDSDENPLEENPLSSNAPVGAAVPPPTAPVEVIKQPDTQGTPKVSATLGFGTWMRSLRINEPDDTFPAPKYDSGSAFALGFGVRARPLAFLMDGFLASFYTRLGFLTMLGLESRNKRTDNTGTEVEEVFGTSLWELRWELVGYDWNILDKLTSPHLEGGFGFGKMGFSISWPAGTTDRSMPDASYTYLLFCIGSHMPFIPHLGGHVRLDYRMVTGTGEIEDSENWYGPSSTGGINLLLGVDGNYKGFVASAEYSYTRYFYDFTEAEQRVQACNPTITENCRKAAGGALDIYNALMLNIGYSF